ncbi:MAG: hypothetical protein B7Y26_01690 [Hydrogenophilales bacterium 16-64-46]|nr:MAG: hypothetical protein B7Z32_01390 [Hydrogenophilales bacterium 12-64-13]OYZ06545.1 MAG: hypothetical protein B7Y26_01690 [Hydrogenophilales bacterium 16-64-46]OZA39253.1 MAG: hypothetical protein B7X87_02795 [Hydrogenophilales bacterium 17-64-34]HQS98807.1 PEP-CTERM sorting domain-containing protein [Thiobacillus sp.]
MHARLTLLTAALAAAPALCTVSASANAEEIADSLSGSGVYSAAADIGSLFFSQPAYVPTADITETIAQAAAIDLTEYSAQATSTLGSNHASVEANGFSNGAFGVGSFSGWYDQVIITGGTGTGTIQFSVQLSGVIDAGAYAGGAAYGLFASTLHPTQLVDTTNIINTTSLPLHPWALGTPISFGSNPDVATITSYDVGVSPYNDTEILFPSEPFDFPGFPSVGDPSDLLGGEPMDPVLPDLILTPGADQVVNVTLIGTLEFTYGEAFYLIGALGTTIIGDGLEAFCSFIAIGDPCTPTPKDGSGATTLDFSDSAHLVSIKLPEGASASFASGAAYNVTSVPEPGEWLMLLAGLGLVGWRARRRA